MIKTMKARFKSIDSRTGQPIHAGDEIQYDTVTGDVWLYERGDMREVKNPYPLGMPTPYNLTIRTA